MRAAEARLRASATRQTQSVAKPIPFGNLAQKVVRFKNSILDAVAQTVKKEAPKAPEGTSSVGVSKVSILEISVTMRDAILGMKKTVEIGEPEGLRKISINIPPGVKTGSVLRFREKSGNGEELVFIIRVGTHPFLCIENKGVVVDIPISINEAFAGASLTLPTFEEAVIVKIPPLSQSGTEIRVKGKGVLSREGQRGDLFYRLLIKLPEALHAVGIKEKISELESYYAGSVRQGFSKTLLEFD